jgi:PEP-CTERM motif
MSHCLRRLVSPIAVMAGILILGVATPARAGLDIWVSTVNNPPVAADLVTSVASGTGFQSVTYNNTSFGGVWGISALATSSNSPGTSTTGFLAGSNVTLTNNDTVSHTIYISLGDVGFTMPVGGVNVDSHIANTVIINGAGNLEHFQSFVNESNAQNATSGNPSGDQTPSIVGPTSAASDVFYSIAALTSPFGITETFAITLDGGSQINFASNTTLTPATVPEPSSLVLGGIGALGMIGYGLRRRKALGA